ncbi:AC4 [Jatropha yellow mosaic virus]|uniref:AC4 n=1 Tax=Jatropha yellow mosaic virus TaxID=1485012 RepID=B6DXE9_9GEMI|nr:AC4 [Jatropha yellow mosaic virus]ACI15833.2 AC4 [Jatropha yellow mosaic virus]
MGNPTYMFLSSSKENTSANISDSLIWSPQPGQHNSIQTSRELKAPATSSPIWRRTETPSTGESFRSMEDLHEEDNNQPMTLTPQRLTQGQKLRPSIY